MSATNESAKPAPTPQLAVAAGSAQCSSSQHKATYQIYLAQMHAVMSSCRGGAAPRPHRCPAICPQAAGRAASPTPQSAIVIQAPQRAPHQSPTRPRHSSRKASSSRQGPAQAAHCAANTPPHRPLPQHLLLLPLRPLPNSTARCGMHPCRLQRARSLASQFTLQGQTSARQ